MCRIRSPFVRVTQVVVTPAAIAGETPSVLCMRMKL
jgi:hypothetical protein